jgi:hypothetical protein
MEIEKLFECLLAKMETDKEEMKADRKTDKEDFMARLDANMKAWQEKADTDMKAWEEEIHSMRFETTNTRSETMACQEMEAHPEEEKEPTSVYRKPEVAQQREVPVEDAEEMPVGESKKKRRRDRKLAAERRHQEPNCAPQKKLAAARRGTRHCAEVAQKMQTDKKMPRRATVARRMRDIFRPNTTRKRITIGKVRTRDNVVRGTQKGWTPRWRQLMRQEGTKETRNRDFEEQLRLGSEMTTNGSYRKAIGLEISKRTAGTSTGLPKMKNCTLWRGRPPPKRRKGNSPYGRNR